MAGQLAGLLVDNFDSLTNLKYGKELIIFIIILELRIVGHTQIIIILQLNELLF